MAAMLSLKRFIWMWAAAAVGLWVADGLMDSVRFEGLLSLFTAGLFLALANLTIKPLLMLVALPVTILSFGLMIPVINGLVLWAISFLVPGFAVSGFWAGVLAALVVSVFGFFVGLFSGQARFAGSIRTFRVDGSSTGNGREAPGGEVIDVEAREKPGRLPGDR